MYDQDLIGSILINAGNSIDMIIYRFNKIRTSSDFINTNDGMEVLNSISMRLNLLANHLKRLKK